MGNLLSLGQTGFAARQLHLLDTTLCHVDRRADAAHDVTIVKERFDQDFEGAASAVVGERLACARQRGEMMRNRRFGRT